MSILFPPGFFKRMLKIPPRVSLDDSELFKKKLSLVGAFVACIDCRGCMAEDHQIEFIGRYTGFGEFPNNVGEYVEVKILKVAGNPYDIRDNETDLGRMMIPVADSCLQQIVPGFFCWFR